MAEITCQKCGHTWFSNSSAIRICCSKCRSSITVTKMTPADKAVVQSQILTQDRAYQRQQLTEVKFPKTLWKDVRLAQRFMALDNMGEKWIMLKVDSEGMLSL
jgi:hypothetical protein